MRLLVVTRRLPPDRYSGTETFITGLSRAARAAGHDVRVVAGWEHCPPPAGAAALSIHLARRGRLGAYRALHRAARAAGEAWAPDAVIANQLEAPAGPWPSLAILHDMNFGGAGCGALRRQLYRRRAEAFSERVAVSEATARSVRDAGLRGRVRVIPPGLELERFVAGGTRTERISPAAPLRLACLGRLHPAKGQLFAIRVLGLLPGRIADCVRLTIAGAVVDTTHADRLAAAADRDPRIRLATDLPDLAPLYAEAEVVLFPTRLQEGFGYAAAEAVACGVPVLHARQQAVDEATFGGGTPLDAADPTAWATAITRLVDGELAAARTRAYSARERLRETCGWGPIWRRYERVLEGMVA